jgi:hypothetical protein
VTAQQQTLNDDATQWHPSTNEVTALFAFIHTCTAYFKVSRVAALLIMKSNGFLHLFTQCRFAHLSNQNNTLIFLSIKHTTNETTSSQT